MLYQHHNSVKLKKEIFLTLFLFLIQKCFPDNNLLYLTELSDKKTHWPT